MIARLSITIVLLCFLAAHAGAEVVQTGGPVGGDVSALIEIDGDIYAGTGARNDPNGGGRVFRSSDQGGTWQPADGGLPNRAVHDLAYAAGTLFAATSQGVWRSADSGLSWTRADASLWYQITSLAVTAEGHLLAASSHYGVFRSEDGGDSFFAMGNGLPAVPQLFAVLVDGADIWAGGGDQGVAKVWKWDADPQSWSESVAFGSGSQVDSLAPHAGKVFAGVRGLGLQATADGGDSWDESNSGLPAPNEVPIIESIMPSGDDLYVADRYGVYKSTNGGVSFDTLDAAICACDLSALVISGNTLVLGTSGGVERSQNDGATWARANSGLIASQIAALIELPNGRLIAGSRRNGLFLSDDEGASWRSPTTDLGSSLIRGLAVTDDGTIYATAWTWGILRSTDGGEIWRLVHPVDGFQHLATVGNDVFASSPSDGVWESTNGGLDWSDASSGLTQLIVTHLSGHGGTLYAGTFSGQVHSAEPGQAWTPIGSSLGEEVLGIGETDAGDLWAGLGFVGAYVRASGEQGFVNASDGLPYANIGRLQTSGDEVYVQLRSLTGSAYIRLDGDASWQTLDTGEPLVVTLTFLRTDDRIYFGTESRGVRAALLPEPSAPLSGLAAGTVLTWLARRRVGRRAR